MFPSVDRLSELESMRRSIAMLNPRTARVLDREEAMALLQELQDVQRRLWTLRHELRRLLDDVGP
jgi:predicted  nucleic acid-binding Zn-ribbon protein